MSNGDGTTNQLQSWLEAAIQSWGPVDARFMFGVQAYLVTGKMFAAVGSMGILLKLPPSVREPLLAHGTAEAFSTSAGASFGEWIALTPERWQADRQSLLALVRQSYEYVQSAPAVQKPPRETRRFRKRQF